MPNINWSNPTTYFYVFLIYLFGSDILSQVMDWAQINHSILNGINVATTGAAWVVILVIIYGTLSDKGPPVGSIWVSRIGKGLAFTAAVSVLLIGPGLTLQSVQKIQSEASTAVEHLVDDKARAANQAALVTLQRKAEIDQAAHEAEVAAAIAGATKAVAKLGCDALWYRDLSRCWTVSIPPETAYDHKVIKAAGENRRICVRSNAPDVVSISPGSLGPSFTNDSNRWVHDFFVYELFEEEEAPTGFVCPKSV